MDLIRFTGYLFAFSQLVEVSIAKSVNGKTRSTTKEKNSEKALYGKIYEETKHDVNRAIEDAILEASKKATDLALQPKVQSKLVDNMTSKIQADSQGSGEEMVKKSTDDKPIAPTTVEKKASKKHHKGTLQTKHLKEETPSESTHKKANENSKHDEDDGLAVTSFEDDESDSSGSELPTKEEKEKVQNMPKKAVKTKEHMEKKKGKGKAGENEQNIIDASETGPDTEDTGDKDDNDAPGDDADEMEEKNDLVPSDEKEKEAETKNSKPTPKLTKGAKASKEGGQEDLKQLLDESINNLVRANSAVEVLLRATNQRPPMQQFGQRNQGDMPCLGLRCNQTLTEAPLFQSALYPQCENFMVCNASMTTQ